MKAWDPVFSQLALSWAGGLLIAALGAGELWRARRRPRAEAWAAAGVFAAALTARVWASPWSVLHVNAHGYEYLNSVFTLQGCFYKGGGYCAFFHPLAVIFGRSPDTVFAANAALGALSALMLVPIGRHLLGGSLGPWAAALAYALLPPAWRLGGTEDMFPLATALALGSLWAWLAALREGGLSRYVLAAACLSASFQTRPDMVGWLVPLAFCLPLARRPWREVLRGTAAGIACFAALAGPWTVSMLRMLGSDSGPTVQRLFPASAPFAFPQDAILLDQRWTPPLLWLLFVVGAWQLWKTRRWALLALLAGIPAAAWQILVQNNGEFERLRLQSPSFALSMLLAGAGAAWAAQRLPKRWLRPGLSLLAVLLAAGALARVPLSRQAQNAQLEYSFLRRAMPGLPAGGTIVMPDRFMAGRVISTEFPTWWLGGRPLVQLSRFLAAPGAAPEPRLFYFGLSCQTFTPQETPPPDGVRPECRAVEKGFRLEAEAEASFPSAPDGFMPVPNAEVRFGFYRLETKRPTSSRG
jgi:4-amino-4-deoxy-L-arabinose transferase-like glycosyltransferase